QRDYSRWLNIRLRRRGHSWENRYFSSPLDPAHVDYAMRYVEFNPVRAELLTSVLDYPWSSAVSTPVSRPPRNGLTTVPGRIATHLRNGGRCLGSASGNPLTWPAFGMPAAMAARSAASTA